MVLSRDSFFVKETEGTAENAVLSFKEENDSDIRKTIKEFLERGTKNTGDKMKIYKAAIDNLQENGVRHLAGEVLKVAITDERAANLIAGGYIVEVVEEAVKTEIKKEFEAPINRMVENGDTETKTEAKATGKGASLLKKKR